MDMYIGLLVLATSIWTFFDARKIGVKKGLVKGFGNLSPTGWLIFCLLLWLLAFPLHLAKRPSFRRAAADGQS
ncbi:MAG: hypothetical protein R8K46_08500 [Mariprofundaceae bacterium]